MRRHDREITDDSVLLDILEKNYICHVAMSSGLTPYVVPMNYVFLKGSFYLHTHPGGKRLEILEKNPLVCMNIIDSVSVIASDIACNFSMAYRSITVDGHMHFVDSVTEKEEALQALVSNISGNFKQWEMSEELLKKVTVFRVDVISMTGKQAHTHS